MLVGQTDARMLMPPQPDFSGRWTLVVALPTDADAAPALTVHQSVRRANIRGEPMTPFYDQIAIERGSGPETHTDTFMIGIVGGVVGGGVGTQSVGVRPRPMERRFAVTWEDRTLVFENDTYTGDRPGTGDWSECRERWTLQPNGELAIDIATATSGSRARTVSATYRRRE